MGERGDFEGVQQTREQAPEQGAAFDDISNTDLRSTRNRREEDLRMNQVIRSEGPARIVVVGVVDPMRRLLIIALAAACAPD